MPGFSDVKELKLVERHIKKLSKLDAKAQRKIMASYRRIRTELRDRLDTIGGDTFTSQKLRVVLVQIEAALVAMESGLLIGMSDSSKDISEEAVKNLITEIKAWDREFAGATVPISISAIAIAANQRTFLINRYESSIRSYSADLRQQITMGLLDAVASEDSVGEVVRKLSQFFLGEEWKLRRIARTEIHHIYNFSKLGGMKEIKAESIPDLKKTLYHPIDERTAEDSLLVAAKRLIVDVNKPFIYNWKGKKRVFMTPPDRPNDRSVMIPYREEWD